jgi:hypothetical protein
MSPSAVCEESCSIGTAVQAQNQLVTTEVSDLPISSPGLPECSLGNEVATEEPLELGFSAPVGSENRPSDSPRPQADDLRIDVRRHNPDPNEMDRLDGPLTANGALQGETPLDGDEWDPPNETLGAKDFEERTLDEAVQDCAFELRDEVVFLDAAVIDEPPDYDPDARQELWSDNERGDKGDEDGARHAREKAAIIASVVEVTTRREQEAIHEWLTEFFLEFPHPATFQAIARISSQGITPDLLRGLIALRRYSMERPEWWISRHEVRRAVRPLRNRSRGLGWAATLRVCRHRADYPPEDMIDENWFQEWLSLPLEAPGYFSFSAYVDAKVTNPDRELLYEGLVREQGYDGEAEMDDNRGWWRRLSRYDESIRFGFSILTPFRDGFGPLGYPEMQNRPTRSVE